MTLVIYQIFMKTQDYVSQILEFDDKDSKQLLPFYREKYHELINT